MTSDPNVKRDVVAGITFIRRPALRPDNEYRRRTRTDHLVVHCSATPPTWDGGAEEIREWHVEGNHWLDIGYHFVIRRDGTVESGRPSWAVGSGVSGHNARSLHVCLVGGAKADGRTPEANFTPAQYEALAAFLREVKKHIYPTATVLGHRDFPGVRKDCPSFDVKQWWTGVEQGMPADVNAESLGGFVQAMPKGRQ